MLPHKKTAARLLLYYFYISIPIGVLLRLVIINILIKVRHHFHLAEFRCNVLHNYHGHILQLVKHRMIKSVVMSTSQQHSSTIQLTAQDFTNPVMSPADPDHYYYRWHRQARRQQLWMAIPDMEKRRLSYLREPQQRGDASNKSADAGAVKALSIQRGLVFQQEPTNKTEEAANGLRRGPRC